MKMLSIFLVLIGLVAAQYDNFSAPFRLILKSDDPALNGTALGACHQGAATEGLCVTTQTLSTEPTDYTTFTYATSSSAPSPYDTQGLIYWNLTIAGGTDVPSALELTVNYNSDIAIPIFTPGEAKATTLSVAADCEDLYIPRSQDDTVSPPAYLDQTEKATNWYVCLTRYAYLYETLVWKMGAKAEPQNPSCKKVQVTRVFN